MFFLSNKIWVRIFLSHPVISPNDLMFSKICFLQPLQPHRCGKVWSKVSEDVWSAARLVSSSSTHYCF